MKYRGTKSGKGASPLERAPVGLRPYKAAPLSGLYWMCYNPPPRGSLDKEPCNEILSPPSEMAPLPQGGCPSESDSVHQIVHGEVCRCEKLEEAAFPLFDLYSFCSVKPFDCNKCNVHMDATPRSTFYRISQQYRLSSAEVEALRRLSSENKTLVSSLESGWAAFFFPLSECGKLRDSLLVCVNGILVSGDAAWCDLASDGRFRPVGSKPVADLPSAGTCHNGSGSPSQPRGRCRSLFYYIVSPLQLHHLARPEPLESLSSSESGIFTLDIEISWRSNSNATNAVLPATAALRKKAVVQNVLLSYYCLPRLPDAVSCRVQYGEQMSLFDVTSPNLPSRSLLGNVERRRNMAIFTLPAKGQVRDAQEDQCCNALQNDFHPLDYVLLFQFYWRSNLVTVEEGTHPFMAAIVVAGLLVIIWYVLTKDLVL